MNSDAQIGAVHKTGGISGSGEELALTLEKVVSQLTIIASTLHVLEQRVSMNENSVNVCLQYFRDARERNQHMPEHARAVMNHVENPDSYRSELVKLKEMTQTIKTGIDKLRLNDSADHHSSAR